MPLCPDPLPSATTPCPCGSGLPYARCCGALHAAFAAGHGLTADTP